MENSNLVPARLFCTLHHIELQFIHTLADQGMIEISFYEEEPYLLPDQLKDLELITRLYADLGINPEGIDAIMHLLDRIHALKGEVVMLRNRLQFYEP
jgi:hypothetical protein